MSRGAWWATVHGVTKSQTGLSEHSTDTHTGTQSGGHQEETLQTPLEWQVEDTQPTHSDLRTE